MTTVIRDLELQISEAHRALTVKDAADAHARLRDEFAMAALTGLMSGSYKWSDVSFRPVDGKTDGQNTALCAYHIADAMMEARNANR